MELFFLIAIGITVISFISIVLTKPSPVIQQKLLPGPGQTEFIIADEAKSRDLSLEQEYIILEVEKQELIEEEALVSMA
jgi:hypothetical protein